MIFDDITDKESYWGEVVSVDDDKFASRIKVRVITVFDNIPVEIIPWAMPRYIDGRSHDLPYIGEIVQVKFMNDDINFPQWYRMRKMTDTISKDDYPSSVVISEKDLSKYNLDGSLSVRYTKSEGLVIELKRNNKISLVTVRNDNSVILTNGNTKRSIHISNESVSIGSENKSQQPSVVGDDNMKALQMINDTIKSMSEEMDKNLKLVSTAASASPYTKHLTSPLKKYASSIKSLIQKLHKQNEDFFPETKSTISTIDKT